MKKSNVEWIGEIPETWETRRLKVALTRIKEVNKKYGGEKILSLTKDGVIIRDLINPTGKMPATFDGYQKIDKGNLITCLFDIDVTPRCVGIAKNNGLTSPAYTQYKVNKKFDTKFIFYYLLMLDNDKIIVPITKSLRNTIKNEDFLNLEFSFPLLKDQRKISYFLDKNIRRINDLKRETNQSIEELKKYKQLLIAETVIKGLDPNVEMKDSEIEWIKEYPKHWSLRKVNNYFSQVKHKNEQLQEENLLSLSYGAVIRRSINSTDGLLPANFKSYNIVNSGDIVLRMTDLQNDKVSLRTGYVTEKGIITSAYITIRTDHTNEIESKYIQLFLHSFDIYKGFYGMGSGVRQNVTYNDIKKVELLVPPIEEQQKMVSYIEKQVDRIDKLIEDKSKIIEELESYKKSLIYEYVTGKKEV